MSGGSKPAKVEEFEATAAEFQFSRRERGRSPMRISKNERRERRISASRRHAL